MNKRKYNLTLWVTAAVAVLTAAVLTTATYAWFTANGNVETETVTARTGSADLELQLSSKPEGDFSPETVKDADGNQYFAHTLNNTVVAPPRMLIAFLENNLNADGSVNIPTVLQPYMGGMTKLTPKH